MEDFVTQTFALVANNNVLAGLALFVLTLLEALLVVGVLIPIVGVMLAVGALVAQGVMHPVEAVLWCSAGAAVGDALSYMLGHRLGGRHGARMLFSGRRRLFARAKLLARRHGAVAIVAARYLGPVRPMIPILAGMSRARPWRFHIASALTAPIWVVSLMAPGYFAVNNLQRLDLDPGVAGPLAVAALIIVATIWLAFQRPRAVLA
jgi:membrane protein DedA with SNARE-associated domain